MDESALETELQAKGLTNGPRVTPQIVNDAIREVRYIQPHDLTLTICIIELYNGFTVTGESACINPANFDEDVGRRIACDKAKSKVWELEAYRLASEALAAEAFADLTGAE